MVEGRVRFNVPLDTVQVIRGRYFYRSCDLTNSVKALKEDLKLEVLVLILKPAVLVLAIWVLTISLVIFQPKLHSMLSATESKTPFSKLKWLNVGHLEFDLHQRLIISRAACQKCLLWILLRSINQFLRYAAHKTRLQTDRHTTYTNVTAMNGCWLLHSIHHPTGGLGA